MVESIKYKHPALIENEMYINTTKKLHELNFALCPFNRKRLVDDGV